MYQNQSASEVSIKVGIDVKRKEVEIDAKNWNEIIFVSMIFIFVLIIFFGIISFLNKHKALGLFKRFKNDEPVKNQFKPGYTKIFLFKFLKKPV